MVIVLLRIISQRFVPKLPTGPREIKWMFQEMFCCDIAARQAIRLLVHFHRCTAQACCHTREGVMP